MTRTHPAISTRAVALLWAAGLAGCQRPSQVKTPGPAPKEQALVVGGVNLPAICRKPASGAALHVLAAAPKVAVVLAMALSEREQEGLADRLAQDPKLASEVTSWAARALLWMEPCGRLARFLVHVARGSNAAGRARAGAALAARRGDCPEAAQALSSFLREHPPDGRFLQEVTLLLWPNPFQQGTLAMVRKLGGKALAARWEWASFLASGRWKSWKLVVPERSCGPGAPLCSGEALAKALASLGPKAADVLPVLHRKPQPADRFVTVAGFPDHLVEVALALSADPEAIGRQIPLCDPYGSDTGLRALAGAGDWADPLLAKALFDLDCELRYKLRDTTAELVALRARHPEVLLQALQGPWVWPHLALAALASGLGPARRVAELLRKGPWRTAESILEGLADGSLESPILQERLEHVLAGPVGKELAQAAALHLIRNGRNPWQRRRAAAKALERPGPWAAEALSGLFEALEDPYPPVRRAAEKTLSRLTKAPGQQGVLLRALRSPSAMVRAHGARLLAGSKAAPEAAVMLRKLVSAATEPLLVRAAAAAALAAWGGPAASWVEILRRALSLPHMPRIFLEQAAWGLGRLAAQGLGRKALAEACAQSREALAVAMLEGLLAGPKDAWRWGRACLETLADWEPKPLPGSLRLMARAASVLAASKTVGKVLVEVLASHPREARQVAAKVPLDAAFRRALAKALLQRDSGLALAQAASLLEPVARSACSRKEVTK